MNLSSPKGLMLHGEVGTGKSMLVDLFADCLPNSKKKRTHFNTFMLETFAKLENLRATRNRGSGGPTVFAADDHSLLWLAKDMIQKSPILFLDEFQMPDRVASKILTNLMTGFFQLGGVLIATSNRMPEELAKAAGVGFAPAPQRSFGWSLGRRKQAPGVGMYGGYNEFAAFLDVLKARCEVWEVEGGKDWRRIDSGSTAPVKGIDLPDTALDDVQDDVLEETPVEGNDTQIIIPDHFKVMDGETDTQREAETAAIDALGDTEVAWAPTTMTVYGRPMKIPRAYKGVTKWTFEELCKAAHGPADYISLASTYHTLILTDVPVLTWLMKNEARRLITLLDALYECRCKLFVSAAAGPDDIFFPEQQKKDGEEEGDSVYSETLSEVYQDATAPFRPNILTENPNYAEPQEEPDYTHARLSGLLRADSLEDDAPGGNTSRGAKGGSASNPFGRSFGKTDAEMQRAPVDHDEVRYTARPNFQKTSAFTGEDERFAYKRAQSRLWEMCSARWWARVEDGWHRPTPRETRRWESDALLSSLSTAQPEGRLSEISMGEAIPDETRPAESFKPVKPAKPKEEQPRKIGWEHFWGTIKWPGTRAGAWGKGPDGLKDRKKEK